ncbi:MAG: hypothetical protein U9O94_05935 [Nanoarchaeota archaeon]|nr:hypothetical protein [Nanoarchaeota archaeon]
MTTQFMITDTEFMQILNKIIQEETTTDTDDFTGVTSMQDNLVKLGLLDSLGIMVLFVWLGDMFGIAEDTCENYMVSGEYTVQSIKEFVITNQNKTYTIKDVEEFNTCS